MQKHTLYCIQLIFIDVSLKTLDSHKVWQRQKVKNYKQLIINRKYNHNREV
ncbi:hypothetical protein N478_03000 [Pseudoalteromonas luteoviolacea S4060-1]|uniref:Uncharacterized protein n=1 Tax=Pseudoalteromonas luteoviolacea S4060-1 TaxID=1365257 RepID=A0A167LPT3_9GAMM|nr:hypothetical protein N478_03000 [Pseudoalteromonas luteoviolacea S4060-1]